MSLTLPADLQAYSVRQDLKDTLRLHSEDPDLVAMHVSNSVELAVRDLVLCASDEDREAYLATLDARLLDIEERNLLRVVSGLQSYGPPPPVTPTTLLLAHFEGMDLDIDYTDETGFAWDTMDGGNNVISSNHPKFGLTSATSDGGTAQTLSDETIFASGDVSNQFTMEYFAWSEGSKGSFGPAQMEIANGDSSILLLLQASNFLSFYAEDGGVIVLDETPTVTVASGQWYHVALEFDNGVWSGYLEGNRVVQVAGDPPGSALEVAASQTVRLGMQGKAAAPRSAYVDAVRISRGLRYNAATYTVPASPFVLD